MESVPPLADDEILLRRVPPSTPQFTTIQRTSDGSERPTSSSMTPRKDSDTQEVEVALSCTRLRLTSPRRLLDQLSEEDPPIDPTGWSVCWFRVADVIRIQDGENGNLEVHPEPREECPIDLGHCGIYGASRKPCPSSKSTTRKLAKIARVLTPDQVTLIRAGDSIH